MFFYVYNGMENAKDHYKLLRYVSITAGREEVHISRGLVASNPSVHIISLHMYTICMCIQYTVMIMTIVVMIMITVHGMIMITVHGVLIRQSGVTWKIGKLDYSLVLIVLINFIPQQFFSYMVNAYSLS